MISFKQRSLLPELMDGPDISPHLIHRNFRELDILNRYMGGHSTSIVGINKLITDPNKEYHIVDLGCGSGDALKYIAKWARSKKIRAKLTGVDKNAEAIRYLLKNCSGFPEISGVVSDYRDYLIRQPMVDIVHCSLFCHHLNNDELMELLQYLKKTPTAGFVINDLQRSKFAYFSAWISTRLLNGSVLSKHDGPVSVLRAFTFNELKGILNNIGIKDFFISKRWAFRFLVVAKTAK